VKSTQWSNGMYATVGGKGITSRAGAAGARMLLDKVGMPAAITAALAGTTTYPGHNRGRVVTDLVVTIADGGTRLGDVNALADQGELFGPVASVATGWRVLAETASRLDEIAAARTEVRAHVWEQIAKTHGGRIPPSTVAGTDLGDVVVLRVDATIVIAHSRGASGPRPAQLSLFEQPAGFRFQVTATNLPTGQQVPFLEAVHRLQARVEAFIRRGRDTGLRRLPSQRNTINLGWCVAVAMACDLLAWLRLLTLDGELAKAEPKTLRYRVLHVAARIIRSGRRREIRIPETWPWAGEIAAMFDRIKALPART